jgi:hypothetical protein
MGELLWHYTNAAGLIGILDPEHNEIWASNIDFMNDATENNRLREILAERVRSKQTSESRISSVAPDAGKLVRDLFGDSRQLFVTCFSECRDSLSQWRAYGGFAIGFDKEALSQFHNDPPIKLGKGEQRRYFGPVHYYSETDDEDLIDCLAQGIIDNVDSHDFWNELKWLTPRFKDRSFSEEKEWRLICTGNVDRIGVQFRAGFSALIPYIPVKLQDISYPIQEIIVGPGPSSALNEKALNLLIDSRHAFFKVSKTTVPFRNW